jgi:hypothetical protein
MDVTKPISKSQFKLGLSCIQKLKHYRDGLPQTTDEDSMLSLLSEGGATIEVIARALEPGKLLGGFGGTAVSTSMAAVKGAFESLDADITTCLYEVTVEHDGFMARIDRLRIQPGRIDLVEIKSKSVEPHDGEVPPDEFLTNNGGIRTKWLPYFQDLAFQKEVLRDWLLANREKLGINAALPIQARLLLVNKTIVPTIDTYLCRENFSVAYDRSRDKSVRATVDYIGKGVDVNPLVEVNVDYALNTLIADAGSKVQEFEGLGIQDSMLAMRSIVTTGTWPAANQSLSTACKKCSFRMDGPQSGFDRCWDLVKPLPEHHVLTLGRISGPQFNNVIQACGTNATIRNLDRGTISPTQRFQFEAVMQNRPIVEQVFAADPLVQLFNQPLDGPIYFMDFETAAYPVPGRVGVKPFTQIPFQWEAHRLPAFDSPLSERVRLDGYLELNNPDTDRAFVDALINQIGDSGPIFHWHAFEALILKGIKARLTSPDDADRRLFIETLIGSDGNPGRLIDLLPIAKASFYHPDQLGSYSIKKVLPIAWQIPSIREQFTLGHQAAGDPEVYIGEDPYYGLPAPPAPILEAIGGIESVHKLEDDEEEGEGIRNGGMAMLAYHYVRLFGGADDPEIISQFRRYCRLDSAAMVMVYGMMRDHVSKWEQINLGD